MTRSNYYKILERLSADALDMLFTLDQHEHAVEKLNAFITALEVGRIIPVRGLA
jgi:hypothetical protein